MYNEFFGLAEAPFAIEPNARFIVLTDDHREALATMIYAIEQQEGWAAFVGAPGVGKTTLIIALLQELSDRVVPAVITNPRLEPIDFMNMVSLELGLAGPFGSKGQFLVAFKQLILQCRAAGKIMLLVVDEVQAISADMLEELRLLANIDDGAPRVLNIVLAGQMELLSLLGRPEMAALRQRLRHFYTLRPLGQDETRTYIRHRLRVAGGSPDLFTEGAVTLIHQLTNGVPRLINVLCDESMLVAFARNHHKLEAEAVAEAASNLPMLLGGFPLAEPEPEPAAAPQPAPAAPRRAVAPRPEPEPEPAPPAPTPRRAAAPRPEPEPEPDLDLEMEAEPEPEPAPPPPRRVAPRQAAAPAQAPPAKAAPRRPEPRAAQDRRASGPPQRPPAGRPKIKQASRPAKDIPVPKVGDRGPGLAARVFGSMGKGARGGFLRRLVVLLVLLALALGVYWLVQSGTAIRLGRLVAPYFGLKAGTTILMPEEPTSSAESAAMPAAPEDWGPTIDIAPKENGRG